MKKWKILIENRFQNFDRKFLWKFSKILKKSRFSKNLEKSENFSIQIKLWKCSDFSIFRKSWFFRNFRNFSKNSRSRFQNRFSIKNFQPFSMIFFLNRFYFFRSIQKWRLEVHRTQRGRVSERNVAEKLGNFISTELFMLKRDKPIYNRTQSNTFRPYRARASGA